MLPLRAEGGTRKTASGGPSIDPAGGPRPAL